MLINRFGIVLQYCPDDDVVIISRPHELQEFIFEASKKFESNSARVILDRAYNELVEAGKEKIRKCASKPNQGMVDNLIEGMFRNV